MADNNAILITAGPYQFLAKFEDEAPKTVATFRKLLPYRQKVIHVRWSGEGVWIPLGDADFKLEFENHTAHPAAGQILFYPGGFSETELLFCYGNVAFASKMGALAANHFLTIVEGHENLKPLGKLVLWEGAQDVLFEVATQVKYMRTCPDLKLDTDMLCDQNRGVPQACVGLFDSIEALKLHGDSGGSPPEFLLSSLAIEQFE